MYAISRPSQQYGTFYVADSDGMEDKFTKEELEEFIENGIEVNGFKEEVERQEKIKNQVEELQKEHGADKVHTNFNVEKEEKEKTDLTAKKEILDKIKGIVDELIANGKITRTTELSQMLRGQIQLAINRGADLTEEEARVGFTKLQTQIVKEHPELVANEHTFVQNQKAKKAKVQAVQNQQLKGIDDASSLDFTLYVFTVVGVVIDEDEIKGYNIVSNLSDSVMYTPINILRHTFTTSKQKIQFTNAIYDIAKGILVTTKGIPLQDIYPKIEEDFSLRNINGLTITAVVLDDETDAILGAVCFDGFGVKYNYTIQSIASYMTRGNMNCNFKIKSGVIIPKHCINNYEFPKVHMTIPKAESVYNSNAGEKKPYTITEDTDCAPMITSRVYAFDELSDNAYMQSGEEKYQWACLSLKKVAPYYYTMFQAIKKVPVIGFGTLGVTEDTMIIDYQFVSQCSIAELTYIFIHEMNHIAMQHSIREKNRNHTLWNIACDLYINTIINKDYDCRPGGTVSEVHLEDDPENKDKKRVVVTHPSGNKGVDKSDYAKNNTTGFIQCPTYGVFLESIGETIDLANDTPETIYERLLAENPDFEKAEDEDPTVDNTQNTTNNNNQPQQNQNQSDTNEITPDFVAALQRALAEAQEGAQEGLDVCENSMESQDANKEIQSGIQDVMNGISSKDMNSIEKGCQTIMQGMADMQTAMNIKQMEDAVKQIKEGLEQAGEATGLESNMSNISTQVSHNARVLKDGLKSGNQNAQKSGMENLENSIEDAENTLTENKDFNKQQVQDAMQKIKEGKEQLENSQMVDSLQKGITQLRQGADQCVNVLSQSKTHGDLMQTIEDNANAVIAKLQEGYSTGNDTIIDEGLQEASALTSTMNQLMQKEFVNMISDLTKEFSKKAKKDLTEDVNIMISSLTTGDNKTYQDKLHELNLAVGGENHGKVDELDNLIHSIVA